jgi:hypothetical protein
MSNISKIRASAGLVAVIGTAALGVAALAGPAAASPQDTDRPKVTEKHHDFGENWTLGAPRNGGHLEWDQINGDNYVDLTGYHYLTDKACGRVKVLYYDDDHDLLSTDDSGLHCAPTNGKTQWFVSESYSHDDVVHVHVELRDSANKLIGSDTEDFD